MNFTAGDVVVVGGNLCQIREIFMDFNQALVYDTVENIMKTYMLSELTPVNLPGYVNLAELPSSISKGKEDEEDEDGEESSSEERIQTDPAIDHWLLRYKRLPDIDQEYDSGIQVLSVSEDGFNVEAGFLSSDEYDSNLSEVEIVVKKRRRTVSRDSLRLDFSVNLPSDALRTIIYENDLSYKDILSWGLTSKAFNKYMLSDDIWGFLLVRDYPAYFYNWSRKIQNTWTLTAAIRDAIDYYTENDEQKGRRYFKRFYELLIRIQDPETDPRKYQSGRVGVSKFSTTIYPGDAKISFMVTGRRKILNVWQCGDIIFVMFEPRKGWDLQSILKFDRSENLFEYLTRGPVKDYNDLTVEAIKEYEKQKTDPEIETLNVNVLIDTVRPRGFYMILNNFKKSTKTYYYTTMYYSQRTESWNVESVDVTGDVFTTSIQIEFIRNAPHNLKFATIPLSMSRSKLYKPPDDRDHSVVVNYLPQDVQIRKHRKKYGEKEARQLARLVDGKPVRFIVDSGNIIRIIGTGNRVIERPGAIFYNFTLEKDSINLVSRQICATCSQPNNTLFACSACNMEPYCKSCGEVHLFKCQRVNSK